MPEKNSYERPFLLLTQRRTGATFLTSALSEVSSFDTVQHEPFNLDRQFGHITSHFIRSHDELCLGCRIRDELYNKPNIKHCFELMPFELTKSLVCVAEEFGYGIVFHLRQNEMDRLLSLGVAMACGVWGQKQAKALFPLLINGSKQANPIDVEFLKMEASRSAEFRRKTELLLTNRNFPFLRTYYEEFYFGVSDLESYIWKIFNFLGGNIRKERNLQVISRANRYDSEVLKSLIPNYTEAVRNLSGIINRLQGN